MTLNRKSEMTNKRKEEGQKLFLKLKDYYQYHCANKVPIYLKDPDVNL